MEKDVKDLMIDIETLGTKPGSVILSIGAVAFDAETGELASNSFYRALSPIHCQSVGLTMDAETVAWWMIQSPEAQAAAFSGRDHPSLALLGLANFVLVHDPLRVWAKPPAFDIVLLESVYHRLTLQIPWGYKSLRDCRTLFDVTGVLQPTVGTLHNALDDAKAQAYGVIAAFAKLRAAGLGGGENA